MPALTRRGGAPRQRPSSPSVWRAVSQGGLAGARTWCGHGVFAHNLIKISGLIR